MSAPANISARDRTRLRSAALAIPVLVHEGQHVVLLTQRPEGLSAHPGEICFPGGKVDAADASPLAAACRELDEEVGISARHVLAYRAEQGAVTSSGYHIEPFVMRIAPDSDIRPNEREVSRCCLLPLTAELVLENYRIEELSIPRDDFGFVFPTPIGPVRGATCTLLLHLAKQVLRFGSFGEYARTFEDLSGTR